MNADERYERIQEETAAHLAGPGDVSLALILKAAPDPAFEGASPKTMAFYLKILQDDDAYHEALSGELSRGLVYGAVLMALTLYAFDGWVWQVIAGLAVAALAALARGSRLHNLREKYGPLARQFRQLRESEDPNERSALLRSIMESAKRVEESA